jgi:NAD(P)-dependent dehydrogenase (short-subunit alcohol dehydrogenase family)|tara:strand:- start:742 stop:1494 length:753 start_codon:yes stop_codon:yes gene_type:complete
MSDLSGKVFIVTGGESGIGQAIAMRAVRDGANIVIAGINNEGLDETVASMSNLTGNGFAIPTDVTKSDQVQAMVEGALEKFGRIDGAVANAGAFVKQTSFAEMSLDDWNRVVAVNLTGVFLTLQATLKVLLKQGEGGSLLATGSSTAIRPIPGMIPYTASKGGVHQLMRALAIELAEDKIRCNTIVPGVTRTQALMVGGPEYAARGLKYVPMDELVEPEELAALVSFALGDEAPHMTGTMLKVDAGRTSG